MKWLKKGNVSTFLLICKSNLCWNFYTVLKRFFSPLVFFLLLPFLMSHFIPKIITTVYSLFRLVLQLKLDVLSVFLIPQLGILELYRNLLLEIQEFLNSLHYPFEGCPPLINRVRHHLTSQCFEKDNLATIPFLSKCQKNVENGVDALIFCVRCTLLVAFSTSCHRKSNISKKFEF